ncbi:MAG: hypothetical protein KF784_15625 [Fimbriimonadaceae bacterium]|nr:hypothetical protein [Fimbriimonadaceae bacterium]
MKQAKIGISALFALPTSAIACSGADVQDSIRAAIRFAYFNAAFMTIALGVSFFIAKKSPITGLITVFIGILLALHPAWTVNAWGGDCGIGKASAAVVLSLFSGIVVVVQHAWAKRTLAKD